MLYRTTPSAPVFGLRREIDRLFEDTFGRDSNNAWTPAVDVRENQNEVRLDVELPGMNPEDVEITTENGVLTIRGEKHNEQKEEDESRFHVIERSYGSFYRSFQLPQGLDDSRIEAAYENGILSIHIPKSALPQPKKIEIKNHGGASIGSRNQRQVGTSRGTQSGEPGQGRTNSGGFTTGDQPPLQNQMAASPARKEGISSRTEPSNASAQNEEPTTGRSGRSN